MQKDAVVLEREGPLGHCAREARDPAGQLGARSRTSTKPADPLELLVGSRRVPGAHGLDARATAGAARSTVSSSRWTASPSSVAASPAAPGTVPWASSGRMPGNTLGVVAVRAAIEERERAVREAANPVERRRRDRHQLGQPRRGRQERAPAPRRRRARAGPPPEPADLGHRRGTVVLGPVAVDPHEQARPVAHDLHRAVAGCVELLRLEAGEHPADRRRLVGGPVRVDGARDDQAVDRARHRDVVEAKALGALGLALGLAHALVLEGGPARAGRPGRRPGSRSARPAGRGSRRATARSGRGPRRRRSRP